MMELILDPEMERNEEDNQFPVDPFDSSFSISRHPSCSSCGCNGAAVSNLMKRRSPPSSPFSSSRYPQPKIKKLVLDQDENLSSRGYSKISLPFAFGVPSSTVGKPTQTSTLPPLRRSVSDPSEAVAIVNPGTASISALPPLPTGLRRTVSNPNPLSPGKTFPQSPTKADIRMELMNEESPESKKLKRMTERLREMNQWWNDTMREQEQEDRANANQSLVNNNGDTNSKDICEAEIEETVEVERVEESLIIRFNCPCTKSYKILLSGDNCFYKLV